MTVQLMSILTRRQIGNLNQAAKKEFRSFIANKLQPITGRAELIVTRNDDTSPDLALLIVEDVKTLMKELDELLTERQPESPGGAGAGMSHTPGPWIYDFHDCSFYIFTKKEMEMVADGDPDAAGIARMRGIGRGADDKEQEANARLIAAAPELLEACSLAKSSMSAWLMTLSSPQTDEQRKAVEYVKSIIGRLGDAIRKAEGVQ